MKMKVPPCLRVSVVSLLLGFATAQPQPPAEVPIDQEPHHHLVLENEYVRVFKVEVAPHEATLVHRHTRDYVVVTIGDAEVTNAVVGKEPKKWNFKDGDVTFLEASGEKSFAHKAVNEAGTPFVNYTVELKFAGGKKCDEGGHGIAVTPQFQLVSHADILKCGTVQIEKVAIERDQKFRGPGLVIPVTDVRVDNHLIVSAVWAAKGDHLFAKARTQTPHSWAYLLRTEPSN